MYKIFSRHIKYKKHNYSASHIVFSLLLPGSAFVCQAAEHFQFQLPAMNAAATLNKLADISGYSLLYPFDDSIIVQTNPVFGTYSVSDALAKILLNTPLSAIATDKKVIVVSSILTNYDNYSEHLNTKFLLKMELNQQFNDITIENVNVPSITFHNQTEINSDDNNNEIEAERIQIIGSRRINRSPRDALAPLDIINKHDLKIRSNSDLISALSTVIPSYNLSQEAISDAGTLVRPSNLRGLPTDSILILVNGKRRHRSGAIYEYISGLNIGAHGVDLEPIPSIALKSVEVLRDGAAAQYGSDAIAGVINFRLENDVNINRIEMRTGQYYQGDGTKFELAGIFGSKFLDAVNANFSFELSESDETSRGIQDPAIQVLLDSGINASDIQDPVVTWGAPKITNNIKLFSNIEIDIGEDNKYKQLYLFGNLAQRTVDGSFFYRHPNSREGVFTNPTDGTRLFFDMTNNNSGNCPAPTTPGSEADAEAMKAVYSNDNCFAFNERFPGGFTPRFSGEIVDRSIVGGFRGAMNTDNAELTYDISMVFGRNAINYKLRNSVNASLGQDSPSNFDLGSQIQTEQIFNADFTYPLNVNFESDLNIAFGFQHHFEKFEVATGDKESYETGAFSSNGEAIGANGFPGFSPNTAGINFRRSNAVYLDLETDVTEDLSLSLAIRYEDIGSIGNSFDGKLSSRIQVTDEIAFRSTLSSGFRAPTVAQSTLQRISTSNSIVNDSVLQQRSQLVSALSPIATARSGGELQPETSNSFSLGLLSEIGPLNVTLDYFYIEVDNRLSLFSSEIRPSDAPLLGVSEISSNVTNIQYYANDFNSTTQGVDLVVMFPFKLIGQNDILSLAFNYTNTDLDVTNPKSPITNIDVLKEREEGTPRIRSVLTYAYSQEQVNAMLRVNYYGSFYNAQFNDASLIEKVSPMVITDVEFSYDITDNLVVALGANNVFDVYPDEYSEGRTSGFLGAIYPLNSPTGFNGGHYYMRIGWDF